MIEPSVIKGETILHLVLSVGYVSDASLCIIAAPIGVFRRKSDATMTAQAEQELGEVLVEDMRFKQRTAQAEAKVSGSPSNVWVVWSNAFSKDGTGKFFGRIDGLYASTEEACAKLEAIPQGFQEVMGHMCEIKSEKRLLKVR